MLTYQGQKPLDPGVHPPLAAWVKNGGVLVFVDDDKDPYNQAREWWNDFGKSQRIPRQHLFDALGVKDAMFAGEPVKVGKGSVIWLRENPVQFALSEAGDAHLARIMKQAAECAGLTWKETSHIALRRGPYWIGAGLDESVSSPPKILNGRFINLFDPTLRAQKAFTLTPDSRFFLLDLDAVKSPTPRVLASACKALPLKSDATKPAWTVEGVGNTPAIVLIATSKPPKGIALDGTAITDFTHSPADGLLHIRFPNEPRPRVLEVTF
jgi:hypothetical protein